jgi:hypothetical protein
MDMIAAYNDFGSCKGAAAMCGVDHKTVKRAIAGQQAGRPASRATRPHNYDVVGDVVGQRVGRTSAAFPPNAYCPKQESVAITAPAATSDALWPKPSGPNNRWGRRPGAWAPGEVLLVDWGAEGGLHISAPDPESLYRQPPRSFRFVTHT